MRGKSVKIAQTAPVAIIFGRERVGLTNDELQKCNYHLYIPTNLEYGSLNLAMAVQLVSYEIRMAFLASQNESEPANNDEADEVHYPPADDMERFYTHLESVLNESVLSAKHTGSDYEPSAPLIYPRASGNTGAEYPAWNPDFC